ncbi:MAG: ATP-binding protein, partial [Muribaculaceae bacterium]|nr:ATP-binding protein [Muribaculaceae bacterium]
CGITEKELLDNFSSGIEQLAEEYEESYADMCLRLKKSYDGYRFAKKGSEIYNPWSVLNAMSESRIGGYWNATGAATVIAKALYGADVDVEKILNAKWKLNRLSGLDLRNADPTALLYQTGYLTISSYDTKTDTVRLKVPNNEVREGLFSDLLQFYVKVKRGTSESVVRDVIDAIEDGEPEEMMKSLDAYFAGVPYDLKMDNENNFHNAFYILMTLIGINTKAETHTSDGSIDLLIETSSFIYVIELKYDGTPEQALHQIDEKQYVRKFATDSRKLFKIGVNFSSEARRIEGWKIES